jgi:hypothetical protein
VFRLNPPVSVAIKPVRVALRGQERKAEALGADLHDVYGCGKFGCVYPGKNGTVVKVTTDKHEVRMVKEVIQLRRSRTRLATRYRRRVEALGCSVEKAAMLPGIVAFKEPIVALGKKSWAYRREDVRPLDAMSSDKAKRLQRRLEKAIDAFFYPPLFRPDPLTFLRDHPELKAIVVTALYMEWAFDVRLEDIHVEQLGVVSKTTPLHQRGTVVLFDGQID